MSTTVLTHDDDLTRRARRRVGRKIGFLTHLTVFAIVNAGLALLSLAKGGGWHFWPMAGWGLGLAIHGIVTLIGLQGDGLRERMLASEIEHLKGRR